MKTFILILLFGRSIMLTSAPVDISNEWIEVPLDQEISAINSGATLNVQLSVDGWIVTELKQVDNHFKKLEQLLDGKVIEAVLVDTKGKQVNFTNKGFSIGDSAFKREDSVWVTLKNTSGIVTDRKFNLLKIRSTINIKDSNIIWKNYSK